MMFHHVARDRLRDTDCSTWNTYECKRVIGPQVVNDKRVSARQFMPTRSASGCLFAFAPIERRQGFKRKWTHNQKDL